MQWLKKLLQSSGANVTEEWMEKLCKEIPKHMIPKGEYNAKLRELRQLKEELRQGREQESRRQETEKKLHVLQAQMRDQSRRHSSDAELLRDILSKMEFDAALDAALIERGAKNTRAVSALLEQEKIELREGGFEGLEEQLDRIALENSYLFDKELFPGDEQTSAVAGGETAEKETNGAGGTL